MKMPHDRGGLRFFLVLFALARGAATPWTIFAGTPLLLLGVALHFWTKGCLRQNRIVARGGPYRFVRHPFYLANAMIDAALCVMSGWWVLWLALPFWWLAVYLPVIRGEERYLVAAFGTVYEEYRERVPCLIPRYRPLVPGAEGFSWSNPNIALEGEVFRALRLAAYPLLFLACTDLRVEGLSCFADASHAWPAAMLAALYAVAWGLKPRRKRQPESQAKERQRSTLAGAS
ncbi:MAG: isoprenylcysteine carboxylmethyltransferase family protein, partial [Thermoguttaceae bacterium]